MLGHYAHAGFLNELDRLGCRPQRIAGASGGALAGALWAGGLRGGALEEEICRLNFRRAFVDLRALLRLPGLLSWSYANGLLGGNRMRKRLLRLIGDRRLEELREPALEVAVSNLTRHTGEVRREGPLVELVLASISIPVLYRARQVGGEWLVDGGVANETPFTQWLGDDAVERIVVHRIRYPRREPGRMGLAEVIANCHAIPNAELAVRRVREAEASGKEVVFLTTELPEVRAIHRSADARRMIEAGKATARGWLEGAWQAR
jgi:predicted acylesterase/phospholipase RssA